MQKTKMLKICLMVLPFIFCTVISGVMAKDGCLVQTVTTDVEGIKDWVAKLKINSSSEEIVPGGTIDLWVDTGGSGYPPYTWAVSGTGYSLSGTTTYSGEEIVTLICNHGT